MATTRFGGGVLLERAQSTPPGSVDWQEITNINGDFTLPSGQNTKLDKTTHTSIRVIGRRMQKGAGLADVNDVGATLFFDPDDTVHTAVLNDWETGAARDYRITYADGVVTKVQFRATVGNFSIVAPMNDYLKVTLAFYVETVDFSA
jgi:hypothetical protein